MWLFGRARPLTEAAVVGWWGDGCSWAISGFVWLMLMEAQVCLLGLPAQVWSRWKGISLGGGTLPAQWDKGREGVCQERGERRGKRGMLARSSVSQVCLPTAPRVVF